MLAFQCMLRIIGEDWRGGGEEGRGMEKKGEGRGGWGGRGEGRKQQKQGTKDCPDPTMTVFRKKLKYVIILVSRRTVSSCTILYGIFIP